MNRHIKKAVIFIELTFLVNWSLALSFFALGGHWYTPAGMAVGAAYMFVPMGVAILVQRGLYREPIREPLGVSFRLNRWFLIAWLSPPIVAFATFGVSLLMPSVEYSPQMQGLVERFESLLTTEQLQQLQERMAGTPIGVLGIVLLGGLIAGVTVNAVAGFGEELGWRGLLQKELAFLGFWQSSVLIGLIRFSRTSAVAQRLATGDAVPGPLAFCALRQQQGSGRRLVRWIVPPTRYTGKRRANADASGSVSHRSVASLLMLLAQRAKCRGAGGRAPIAQASTQKPDEPLIGFIWGLWHAPLILQGHNYPQHRVAGVLMMTVWCMLLAPIFSYIRVKAQSVVAVAILHGTLNATYGLSIVLVRGGNDLTTGVTGLPGFVVLAAVILVLWLHDSHPQLREENASSCVCE